MSGKMKATWQSSMLLLLAAQAIFCIAYMCVQIQSFSRCTPTEKFSVKKTTITSTESNSLTLPPPISSPAISTNENQDALSSSKTPKQQEQQQKERLFPKRLFTVFGLEDSGTKFLAATLGVATGALPHFSFVERTRNPSQTTEVQHISLPFGSSCTTTRHYKKLIDVFAVVPAPCMSMEKKIHEFVNTKPAPEECKTEAGLSSQQQLQQKMGNYDDFDHNGKLLYPDRFFVNVTSHIQWYASHGVEATAVILVRDTTVNEVGSTHCRNRKIQKEEMNHAKDIINEALVKLESEDSLRTLSSTSPTTSSSRLPQVVLVSYETLMALKEPYLFRLYQQLGIDSLYVPEFRDGNSKYIRKVRPIKTVLKDLMDTYKRKKKLRKMERAIDIN